MEKFSSSRRDFLRTTGVVATSIILPRQVMATLAKIKKPIKLGMITDLHQDVMHDGPARLKAFLDAMKEESPDALVQLGDFAYPTKKNDAVTKAFEKAHPFVSIFLRRADTDFPYGQNSTNFPLCRTFVCNGLETRTFLKKKQKKRMQLTRISCAISCR